MSKYKYILFDLDGTITEPFKGISGGIIHALNKFGVEVPDNSTLRKFIGPPLRDSFRDFCGFTAEQAEEATVYYREYYSVRGLEENDIMPGMDDALKYLQEQGYKLYVATSKPEKFAKIILEKLGLLSYFDIVAGASFDGTRDKKELVIEYLLEQIEEIYPDFNMEQTIMVGDRHFDINGAKYFSIDSVGVTFGYGDYEELSRAGATYVVDTAQELVNVIIN
ncbi:MAG: HAD family hydrolase [Lachnospiraceae bacterium]|nr:HAD family hydrolase [Lachnospiraceae bacterium]MBQ9934225.1 HAD hydrolase-like protein [Lachnospiraceae bacterium]